MAVGGVVANLRGSRFVMVGIYVFMNNRFAALSFGCPFKSSM